MNMFNIFLGLLTIVIIGSIIMGGLYLGGNCATIELLGGEISPDCLDPVETTKCSSFTDTCPAGTENKPNIDCPETGCDLETCCGPPGDDDVDRPTGGGATGVNEHTDGGIEYFSCSHAIERSRPDDTIYKGDCPWPLKSLTSQTGGNVLEHNGQRWISKLSATVGMTPGASEHDKEIILEKCCPEKVDTYPMCRGKLVGSFGIPPPANMVGAVGGYDESYVLMLQLVSGGN